MAPSNQGSETSQRVFREIENALDKGDSEDSQIAHKLAELKVIARDPRNAPVVYCKSGLSFLGRFFADPAVRKYPKSTLEAARIIANALLLQADLRQCFIDLGLVPSLVKFYSEEDWDHEFVAARIIFLLTYDTTVDFSVLPDANELLESLQKHLRRHEKRLSQKHDTEQMASLALIETLKMLFNICNKHNDFCKSLQSSVPSLYEILRYTDTPKTPLEPPISQTINALALIVSEDSVTKDTVAVPAEPGLCAEKLLLLLQSSIKAYDLSQLEIQIVPLLAVIRHLYETSSTEVKDQLRNKLLPSIEERDKPLGQSKTLASQLLQLQSSPGMPNLSEAISGLLYELSDRDATTFIHNIGYGYAAGYLTTHQIPIPEDLRQRIPGDATEQDILINPITGQRLDAEQPDNLPEMTEEEKEREAERLFVLFERLNATGVMSAANPVRKAMEEGRLEELPDSDPE